MKILIVDDFSTMRRIIKNLLRDLGFTNTAEADDGNTALPMLQSGSFDFLVTDWNMPGMSGIELARRLKKEEATADIPIIMLTAKVEEDNKIQGLEVGADDYITKPFSPRELVARLKAVLRRATPPGVDSPIEVEGLTLDPVGHRVTTQDGALTMGPTEYRLLQFFMTHQERVYTRSQLLDQVWGGNVYVEERTVDVHIRRLRKALGDQYDHLIQTVRGTGYRFSTRAA